MAQLRPLDMAGMSEIKGMGEIKIRKYGQAFLEAIAGWVQIHPELAGEIQHLPDDKQISLLRSPSEEEQALLQRCVKAKLSIKQMTIILDQPAELVESWLKEPVS